MLKWIVILSFTFFSWAFLVEMEPQQNATSLRTLRDSLQCQLRKISCIEYTNEKAERINNKWSHGKSIIFNDLKKDITKIRTIEPKGNLLIDFPIGVNKEIKVQMDYFPYLSVQLSQYNPLFLRDQHHPICHATIAYFIDLIIYYTDCLQLEKASYSLAYHATSQQILLKLGALENEPFWFTNTRRRFLHEIIDSLHLNPYDIVQLNDDKFELDAIINKNQSLLIRPFYAQKCYISISRNTYLPLQVEFFTNDEKTAKYNFNYSKIIY